MDKLHGSLINALKNNKILPIVAAGVSMSIRDKQGKRIFPSWEELLLKAAKKLEQENDNHNATLVNTFLKMNNYQEAAKYAYDGLKGPLWKNLIDEQFRPKLDNLDESSAALPKAIWKLSNQIITLNYDRILQWSHPTSAQVSTLTNNAKANLPDMFKTSNKDPIVWHLHGHIDDTAELILPPDSYARFYGEGDSVMSDYKGALEVLKNMITTRSLLFIGCSLDDADLLLKIHEQQELFAGNTQPHYALVKADEKNEIEKKLNGTHIKLITFENFGQPMLDKLSEMHTHIPSKQESKVVSENEELQVIKEDVSPKIAYLSANPLGHNYDYQPLLHAFKKIPFDIDAFSLTEENLNNLNVYDYIFIASKVVKNKLVIEDDYLCFDKISLAELESNIIIDNLKGIFIFVDKIPTDEHLENIQLPTLMLPALDFKNHKSILKNFYFQVFKKQNISFFKDAGISKNEERFVINKSKLKNRKNKPNKNITDLPKAIDRSSVKGFIGRIEDLEKLSKEISDLEDDNGFLTIKGTGGLGKTTLIKKLTVAFADRGKYEDGIDFIDCEPITEFQQFKYRIATVFNLEQAQDLEEHLNKQVKNKSCLIILDNFETLLYINDKEKILLLLSFMCDFASIVITSREFLNIDGEITYTLRDMTLDEAFDLFVKQMGNQDYDPTETKLVRDEIIDKLLNKNPLAIKLVTGCIMPNKNIYSLKDELENDLFNKISEEDLELFDNATDIHIDRKKSIYGSILYSYKMLNEAEEDAFEKLSLFPDGIDIENFTKLTSGTKKKAIISDRIIKSLQNKSLVENNQSQIKLQSIVGRFAEEMLKQQDDQRAFFKAVFDYNFALVDALSDISLNENRDKQRAAISFFDHQQNNVLKSINYLEQLQASNEQLCRFIDNCNILFITISSLQSFISAVIAKRNLFSDKALQAIDSILLEARYYNGEFEQVSKEIKTCMPITSLDQLNFQSRMEEITFYKTSSLYEMEGDELIVIKSGNKKNDMKLNYDRALYAIGEFDVNYARCCYLNFTSLVALYDMRILDKNEVDKYIKKTHKNEHLTLANAYYVRSKFEPYKHEDIDKLVVINPYVQGLVYLMSAFSEKNIELAQAHYQKAIPCLTHIKYYFVEAHYYYAKFLKENSLDEFQAIFDKGYPLSKQHHYRYLQYCFEELESPTGYPYDSKNYPLPDGLDFTDYIARLTKYCVQHN